jgi:hypothetical protein
MRKISPLVRKISPLVPQTTLNVASVQLTYIIIEFNKIKSDKDESYFARV